MTKRSSQEENESLTKIFRPDSKEAASSSFSFNFSDTIVDEDNHVGDDSSDNNVEDESGTVKNNGTFISKSTTLNNVSNTNINPSNNNTSTNSLGTGGGKCAYYFEAKQDYWAAGGPKITKGQILTPLWDTSTHRSLHVEDLAKSFKTFLPSFVLKLVDRNSSSTKPGLSKDTLLIMDSVWDLPSTITKFPHFLTEPLVLEPGLDSFVWPLSRFEFMDTIYGKRAFVVQGTGERLSEMSKLLNSFNEEIMIQEASRLVVWMKTVKDKRMQYLEASPDVAYRCYLAGHSLYYNPPHETQKVILETLANDLGLNFGLGAGAGDGGDVELFSVCGKHETPWHFDAQENFTIQLRGTKRWFLKKSGLVDPMTNLHPRSTNTDSIKNDKVVHAFYSTSEQMNSPSPTLAEPRDEGDGVVSFLLRPGSVLYAPGGIWHRVSCEEEEGSLSMNVSVDGKRWGDLFVSRLSSFLWRNPGWRERIVVDPRESHQSIQSKFYEKVQETLEELSCLNGEDFLPASLFRQDDGDDDDDEDAAELDLVDGTQTHTPSKISDLNDEIDWTTQAFKRNDLCVLVFLGVAEVSKDDNDTEIDGSGKNYFKYGVFSGVTTQGADHSLVFKVQGIETRRFLDHCLHLKATAGSRMTTLAPLSDPMTLSSLKEKISGCSEEILKNMILTLLFSGFLKKI